MSPTISRRCSVSAAPQYPQKCSASVAWPQTGQVVLSGSGVVHARTPRSCRLDAPLLASRRPPLPGGPRPARRPGGGRCGVRGCARQAHCRRPAPPAWRVVRLVLRAAGRRGQVDIDVVPRVVRIGLGAVVGVVRLGAGSGRRSSTVLFHAAWRSSSPRRGCCQGRGSDRSAENRPWSLPPEGPSWPLP